MANFLFLQVFYFFLIPFIISAKNTRKIETTTSASVRYSNETNSLRLYNVISVPEVHCEPGYILVANKCRLDYDSW